MERTSRLVARVGAEILSRLPEGAPRLAQVAQALGLPRWTLQRRLLASGVTFSDLVDAPRRDLARTYLHQGGLPLADVAFSLGYSEQSAFTRAHRRWFGRPPRDNRPQ